MFLGTAGLLGQGWLDSGFIVNQFEVLFVHALRGLYVWGDVGMTAAAEAIVGMQFIVDS